MASQRLSLLLRRDADHIWRRIFGHPFVVELFTGTLPVEKFRYYVVQDYNYLVGMARALSALASRSDYRVSRLALELAYTDATIEMENYKRLLERLGIGLDEVLETEPAPTNEAYMNYLINTCSSGEAIDCLVAVLPCFWTYEEIAEVHREKLENNRNQLYVDWARTYLSREYRELVERLRRTVDETWEGRGYERLKKIFLKTSRYEYMFWDMAYRLEKWPV